MSRFENDFTSNLLQDGQSECADTLNVKTEKSKLLLSTLVYP